MIPRDSSVEPVRMRESTGNTNAFTKRGTITTPTASTSTQGKNENDAREENPKRIVVPIEKLEAEMHRGDSYVKLFEKMPPIILGK